MAIRVAPTKLGIGDPAEKAHVGTAHGLQARALWPVSDNYEPPVALKPDRLHNGVNVLVRQKTRDTQPEPGLEPFDRVLRPERIDRRRWREYGRFDPVELAHGRGNCSGHHEVAIS